MSPDERSSGAEVLNTIALATLECRGFFLALLGRRDVFLGTENLFGWLHPMHGNFGSSSNRVLAQIFDRRMSLSSVLKKGLTE